MKTPLSSCFAVFTASLLAASAADDKPVPRGLSIPLIDLDAQTRRQVVVDREAGQYPGHVTTVLLEDKKTIIAVYPKGHGRGAIVMKRSTDGGPGGKGGGKGRGWGRGRGGGGGGWRCGCELVGGQQGEMLVVKHTDGMTFILAGDLPQDELQEIADSIRQAGKSGL